MAAIPQNPHFDEGKVVWNDDYSGRYAAPPSGYYAQFDDKWRLVLDQRVQPDAGRPQRGEGYRTDDRMVSRLAYEWTGVWPGEDASERPARQLQGRVDRFLIEGRRCLDAGCGSGRWTRVLQRLGAREVLSVDVSESALESTARFNPRVLEADLTRLPEHHPELVESFDFANLWGVAHHTHDPRQTFLSVAATVRPGGAMFTMLYDVEGMHGSALTTRYRRAFNRMSGSEARLNFAEAIIRRRWHASIPLEENIRNVARNLLRRPKQSDLVGVLDVLLPWYNWTVPVDVAIGWMKEAGFRKITVLNPQGKMAGRHFLGTDKA